MKGYLNDKLIENTYLFCLKRLSDSEDAKDLSQDILYEALRQIAKDKEFVSFHSWYWQMARNKYADFIAHKQKPALPIETAGGMAVDIAEPIEALVSSEDISELNFSISRLASIHREIIIRFYLKEQPVAVIARELNIPEGTVKRRLFDAKKGLKERLDNMKNVGKSSYAAAEIDACWGFNCGEPARVLGGNNKIAQQVCVICRSEAKTVNEIADEMGVAPIYLEPVLEEMTNCKLLTSPAKNKYIDNFCAFPFEAYVDALLAGYEEFRSGNYPERISNILLSLKEKITSLDFYGNDFDYKYLMWLLYVLAGDAFGMIGRERYIQKYEGKYADEAERKYRLTVRYRLPDEVIDYSKRSSIKTMGWSNLHQQFLTADYGRLEYVNDFEYPPFPAKGWGGIDSGRSEWVNGNTVSLLLSLAEDPRKTLNEVEEKMAAEFIKNGLLEKTEAGLKVMLPIFGRKVYQNIHDIVHEALRELACEYADAVGEKIENILLKYVRKELMSNFIHWDMRMLLQPMTYLFYFGANESDHLAIPEDYDRSAAGLYILKM